MPRPRGTEMFKKPSTRCGAQLRTSSTNSDPLPHRQVTGRKSLRGNATDPVNQKKLGSRIADLETQLRQAQGELKTLKEHLAFAEADKNRAREKTEKKSKTADVVKPKSNQLKESTEAENQEFKQDNGSSFELHVDNPQATAVYEVPVQKIELGTKADSNQKANQEDVIMKSVNVQAGLPATSKAPIVSSDEPTLKNSEINLLMAKLEEKEKELKASCWEHESLKKQLNEASLQISAAQSKDEKMSTTLDRLERELEASKAERIQLNDKLGSLKQEKEALETEMNKLRVQTEQWRKAADAAAAVLAGDAESNGRRISERCVSMDTSLGSTYEPVDPCAALGGLSGLLEDGFPVGKRRNSGMRILGDLWRKKGQK